MDNVEFRIDYYKFTVHETDYLAFWQEFYQDRFGPLVMQEHGGIGYTVCYKAAGGLVTLYAEPKQGDYFTLEFKGQACKCMLPDDFRVVTDLIQSGLRIKVNRIDLAFDGLEFTPADLWKVINSEEGIKTFATRKSFRIYESPYEERENGEIGCSTVYIGSRSSERLIRVYNKHGFTRLEMECKSTWACTIADKLIRAPYTQWFEIALSFVRQYFDLQVNFWMDFVQGAEPSDIRVYSARVLQLNKTRDWIIRQVSPAFWALSQVYGKDELFNMMGKQVSKKPELLTKYSSFWIQEADFGSQD